MSLLFLSVLWTSTSSRFIKTQKKTSANIKPFCFNARSIMDIYRANLRLDMISLCYIFKSTAFTMRFTSVISAYASTTAASFPSVKRSVFSAEILINSKTESIARQHISATSAFKYSIVSSTVAQHISTTEGREKTTTSEPTTADHEDGICKFYLKGPLIER